MSLYYQDDSVTIYHGDARQIVPGLTFDVIVTDPPYGMNGNWVNATAHDAIAGDDSFDLAQWVLAVRSRQSVVFGAHQFPHLLQPGGQWFVWDKRTTEAADRMIGTPFEFAYSARPGKNQMLRCMHGGLVNANRPGKRRDHPTEKPVPMLRQLLASVLPGIICDPFAGVGTTLLAAKSMGRTAVGIELEERYCEIAANRCGQEVMDMGGAA